MNRYIKRIAIIAITQLFTCAVTTENGIYAQTLTSSEERQMLLRVVDLLEDYQRYSSMDEDFTNYGSNFRDLFVSDESPVYNDILGVGKGETLYVKDYATLLTTKSSTTRVDIKNITRGDVYNEDGSWKVKCSFDKYVNITNPCGIEFASDFYNTSDYKLTAIIVYNKDEDKCQFETISGEAERIRTIPENYRVVKKTKDLDTKVKFNGKYLDFNALNQALIEATGKPKYSDPNSSVKLVLDNADCNIYHLKLKRKCWHIKLHYDMLNGKLFKYGHENIIKENKAEEQSYGIDFGYVFPSRTSFKTGIFFGAGLTNTKLDLNYTNSSFQVSTNTDVDGDTYTRHYDNLTISQNVDIQSITIPLYFDFAIHFNKIVALVFDLGAKAHYNMSSKISGTTGSAYVYGIYGSEYGNIRLDENFGYNGFGNVTFSENMQTSNELPEISKISVDAFGAAGLRFNIPSTPLALDFNVSYQLGVLNDLIKSPSTSGYIVINSISGMSSQEKVYPLTNQFGNAKRQALKINFGLIFRL